VNNSRTVECAPRNGGSDAPRRAAHVHHTRAARARVKRVQRAGADGVIPRGRGHEVPTSQAARSRLSGNAPRNTSRFLSDAQTQCLEGDRARAF